MYLMSILYEFGLFVLDSNLPKFIGVRQNIPTTILPRKATQMEKSEQEHQ